MAYGCQVRDSSGNIVFSATDRISHHLYSWLSTTTTNETKYIPAMVDERDIAILIVKQDTGSGQHVAEKIDSTHIKVTYKGTGNTAGTPKSLIYIIGY